MPTGTSKATAPPRRPGRPPRTEQQRAAQRARLLEATMTAIRKDGPDQSLEDLAAAAGVSKPVLYDEFGGKQGIADAIAVELTQKVEQSVMKVLVKGPHIDVDTAVRLAVTGLIDLIVAEPNLYTFLVRSMRSTDRGFLDNALVRELHTRADGVLRIVVPTIDLDTVSVLIDGLFGFLFGAIESWQSRRKPSKATMIDRLSAIILTSLQAAAAIELGR